MKETIIKLPIFVKITCILSSLVIIIYGLFILQDIFILFAIATLIAILLNPLVKKLEKYMPRIYAISLVVLLVVIIVGVIIFLISQQFSILNENLPVLKEKFNSIYIDGQAWLKSHLNIGTKQQGDLINQISSAGTEIFTQALGSLYNIVIYCILVPFYAFLLLLYKPLIVEFILGIFSYKNPLQIVEIMDETKGAVQSYVLGLLLKTFLVATLNSVALLILGIKYAILIGVLGGVLNMLPYIGGLVGTLIPMLIALLTNERIIIQVYIIICYLCIQFIDNNFFIPYVVSSKLQINALFSIIIVLLAGSFWGIPGMFLAIPFLGVIKIVCDRVDGYKSIGKLLGTEIPTKSFFIDKRWGATS